MEQSYDETNIPLKRVTKFLRQLTHDVRNGLSSIDLQAAYISELTDDPEVTEELQKLRSMVSQNAKMLRDLSLRVQPVSLHPISWPASILLEELFLRAKGTFGEQFRLETEVALDHQEVLADLESLWEVLTALLQNAMHFKVEGERPVLKLRAKTGGDGLEITLSEPTKIPEGSVMEWGRDPFVSTRHGGYGLGLYRARNAIAAHGGSLAFSVSNGVLLSRISLPLLPPL